MSGYKYGDHDRDDKDDADAHKPASDYFKRDEHDDKFTNEKSTYEAGWAGWDGWLPVGILLLAILAVLWYVAFGFEHEVPAPQPPATTTTPATPN